VIRTTRRLAAACLAVLLLAACGDGPVRAGAAAVVGDERITTEQLQEIVDRGLSSPEAQQQFGADRVDYQTQVLNRMVRALLLEEAAREREIEVTQGDVDDQLAEFADQAGGREELENQAAAGGIHPDDLPRFAREIALEIRLGDELTADVDVPDAQLQEVYEQGRAQFERVRSRHILVESEEQANDILAQLQAGGDFEELAAEFSTDTSNAEQGGDLGWQGRGTFVEEFDNAVFSQPIGEAFVVGTQFGFHVVEVQDREVTTLAQAKPQLRRQALGEQRVEAVTGELREIAERVGVDVNPRFGQWDNAQVMVIGAAQDDGLSSPAPSAPAQPQGGAPGAGEPGAGQPGAGEPGAGEPGAGGDPGSAGDPGELPGEIEPEAPVESPAG
jgi:foldase protein PrsA